MQSEVLPNIAIIAAISRNMGIGCGGRLPWKLKKEMAFFKMITTYNKDTEKQNAVVMGRKTWLSIPEKFRPLPKRINIVLSRNLKDLPGTDYLLHSLEDLSNLLTTKLKGKVETCFIIGGAEVYNSTLSSGICNKMYITRIHADYQCDSFFPSFSDRGLSLTSDPLVPKEEQEEDGVKYSFEVYERLS